MHIETNWTLETIKLVVASLTPIAVAVLGIYLSRVAKRFEYLQWRNQQLVQKRIAVYDSLAPQLNDVLCYFTFVGSWKDFTPPQVVAMKREIDKKIYLAAPLFSPQFLEVCSNFIDLCFATFQGWGVDAKLKTYPGRRRNAEKVIWESEWEEFFSEQPSDPADVRAAYQAVMERFSREIALIDRPTATPFGEYPQ